MKTTSTKTKKTLGIVAKVLSGIIVVFALIMFIGETMESHKRGTSEPMTLYTMLQLMLFGIGLLGLALAWKWKLTGGIISLFAFITLFIVNTDALVWPMLIFPAVAILFIASAYLNMQSKKKSVEEIKT